MSMSLITKLKIIASCPRMFTYIDEIITDSFFTMKIELQYKFIEDIFSKLYENSDVQISFNPWCYIANNPDTKHPFWNYNENTLDEEYTTLIYILHKCQLFTNSLNISICDAKFNLIETPSIAIVGNSPISSHHQDEINKYDIVIRINNCNSWRKNDKIHGLVYRGVSLRHANDFPHEIVKTQEYLKLFHINGKEYDKNIYNKKTHKDYYYYQSINDASISYEKTKEKHRPSCGYFAIRFIQNLYKVKNYHIYGFTFNVMDPSYHNLPYEKKSILDDKSIIYHKPDTGIRQVHHK